MSDSQAMRYPVIRFRIVWECKERMNSLGRSDSVTVHWVPGHIVVKGNEDADELARKKTRIFCSLVDATLKEELENVILSQRNRLRRDAEELKKGINLREAETPYS